MSLFYSITHPDVVVDPSLPIERAPLSLVESETFALEHGWRALDV